MEQAIKPLPGECASSALTPQLPGVWLWEVYTRPASHCQSAEVAPGCLVQEAFWVVSAKGGIQVWLLLLLPETEAMMT